MKLQNIQMLMAEVGDTEVLQLVYGSSVLHKQCS